MSVSRLPPSSSMTVEQALSYALGEYKERGLTDVVIAAFDADGGIVIRASKMNRAQALWLLEKAKLHALEGE